MKSEAKIQLWSGARALAAAVALAGAGCGDDPVAVVIVDPGNGTAVQFKGILVGGSLSGDIDITIAGTGGTVTGCLYLSVASCSALTGTYNTGTKALTLSNASPAISFAGTYAGGEIHGTFTGVDAGEFILISGNPTVYCGTFGGAASGTWNFVIAGGSLEGAYDDGSGTDGLSGTVSGSSVSITFSGGTAAGTISGTSASGTWTASGAGSGTWSGSTSGCRS